MKQKNQDIINLLTERLDTTVSTENFLISPLTEDDGLYMVCTYDGDFLIKFYRERVEYLLAGQMFRQDISSMQEYKKCIGVITSTFQRMHRSDSYIQEFTDLVL